MNAWVYLVAVMYWERSTLSTRASTAGTGLLYLALNSIVVLTVRTAQSCSASQSAGLSLLWLSYVRAEKSTAPEILTSGWAAARAANCVGS